MRRFERKIKDINEILKILDKCEVLRLALSQNNIPYIVPMNFGYEIIGDEISVYLHCAKEGKKLDIIKQNNNICFELDYSYGIKKGEKACNWTCKYESVIGFGNIVFVEDDKSKTKALDLIMEKYGFEGIPAYDEKVFSRVQVLKIKVESISGKSNL